MNPFSHGDTIPLIFYVVYDIYYDILEPHELFYRVMKVLHQIGKNIHGLIHDMEATHEADFVESFDAIWERVCKDIFSMIYYSFIKILSYDTPPLSNDNNQGASPHVLFTTH